VLENIGRAIFSDNVRLIAQMSGDQREGDGHVWLAAHIPRPTSTETDQSSSQRVAEDLFAKFAAQTSVNGMLKHVHTMITAPFAIMARHLCEPGFTVVLKS
jgi:hypothetical protein